MIGGAPDVRNHTSAFREGRRRDMKILILGGTGFLGPQIVQTGLERGHELTLFNRGKTQAELFPDLPKLHGDRAKNDYKSLAGKHWDAVRRLYNNHIHSDYF